jgi:chromosome segregation ATPase
MLGETLENVGYAQNPQVDSSMSQYGARMAAAPTNGHRPLSLPNPSDPEVDATMQAFAQWLSEMKARSNSSLAQMLAEMGIIRDGITKECTELTEYKRQSIGNQQQMQSQLTDLREKLTSAFGEITSLVKQKTATDQELNSEIGALHSQLHMKTAELEALKKSYSSTHQQLQNNLIQTQQQLQTTSGEISAAKKQAQAVQESAFGKMTQVEQALQRLRGLLEGTGREGQSQAMLIQEEIFKLHEALTALSADFFEQKRTTLQVQNRLTSQVSQLEESRRRARETVELPPGTSTPDASGGAQERAGVR